MSSMHASSNQHSAVEGVGFPVKVTDSGSVMFFIVLDIFPNGGGSSSSLRCLCVKWFVCQVLFNLYGGQLS